MTKSEADQPKQIKQEARTGAKQKPRPDKGTEEQSKESQPARKGRKENLTKHCTMRCIFYLQTKALANQYQASKEAAHKKILCVPRL